MTHTETTPPFVSIGIMAWNEEDAIGITLQSLFKQTLFSELQMRRLRCEIICVANGCTDRTASVAETVFQFHARGHEHHPAFSCRVLDIAERGKANAWNVFVHTASAAGAKFLILMDADIVIHEPGTLWNMLSALGDNPDANVAVDTPLKDIAFKSKKSSRENFSLAASRMTQSADAQLTGQLYCLRAAVARNIYLPCGLAACEDGFMKSVVCTDFLTEESIPGRLVHAHNASHIFEAYTRFSDILRNQKRQMMGQTFVHALVDKHLQALTLEQKQNFAHTLRQMDLADPTWLKRLIAEHLSETRRFWRIFPGALTHRLKRLAEIEEGREFIRQLPVAIIGTGIGLVACWLAHRALKRGCLDYWPDTKSPRLKHLNPQSAESRSVAGWESVAPQSGGNK
jgi:glycosyltransferase involved in cell wall biosynthesis